MPEVYKIPHSNQEIIVMKRQDILDCMDKNITNKEAVLAVIEQCEKDAARFLEEGKWTGIPFMGNIRIPKSKQLIQSDEQQELIETAKNTLSHEDYVVFRKQLNEENSISIKRERLYRYFTSIVVKRNHKLYNKLCALKGEYYARVFLYTCKSLECVSECVIAINCHE